MRTSSHDEGLAPLDGPAPRRAAPEAGDTLGRYQLLVPIAAGGMGKVWAARHTGQLGLRKLVAVKVAHPQMAENLDFERMFLDEARIASSIHHPNVCSIHELGDADGVLYLVMEWVNGASLADLLAAVPEARLEPRVAARLLADACAGLHAAHELTDDDGVLLGVIHRDVSPQNILISADGHVKVADFGVAKARGQLHQPTVTGEIKGKIAYLAPEQLTSSRIDRRADIFALGCVLYQASVGRRVFAGGDALITIYQILETTVELPSNVIAGFPKGLEAVIMRALARNPADRFATTEEMRTALQTWIAQSGPPVTEMQVGAVVRSALGTIVDERHAAIRRASAELDRPVSGTSERDSFAGARSGEREAAKAARSGERESAALTSPRDVRGSMLTQDGAGSTSPRRAMTPLGRFSSWRAFSMLATVAFVLSGLLGGATAFVRVKQAAARTEGSARPVAETAAGPAPSGSVGAQTARGPFGADDTLPLTVRVVPSGAVVTLDGRPLASNPFLGSVPRDGAVHTIVARARGFQSASRAVRFDEPRSVDLVLTPLAIAAPQPHVKSDPAPEAHPAAGNTVRAPVIPGRARRPIDQDDPFSD